MNDSENPPSTSQPLNPSTSGSQPLNFPSAAFDAAVAQETRERDLVFVDLPDDIFGIPVVPLTLCQALILISIGSPFLCGGKAELEDIAQFLWYLSPDFEPQSARNPPRRSLWRRLWRRAQTPRQKLLIQIALFPQSLLSNGIRQYIDLIFAEAPGASSSQPLNGSTSQPPDSTTQPEAASVPLTSFASDYIDRFGAEYSWSKEQILDLPLAQIFALLRNMEIRHAAYYGKKAPLINYRSDKVLAAHMERRNTPELKQERLQKLAHLFAQAP